MKIEIKNLTYQWHYSDYKVFDGFNLNIPDKEHATLLIDDQSGKTTLCKLILGLAKPTGGNVLLSERDVANIKPQEFNIAYLTPNLHLFEHKSVLYNLCYPLKVRKVKKSEQMEIATAVAENFAIADLLNVTVKDLTYHQKFTVALARMSVRKIDLVLLDGVMDVLTDESKNLLYNTLDKMQCTVVSLTAEINNCFGNVYLIADSKVLVSGSASEIEKEYNELLWLHRSNKCGNSIDS